MRTLDWIARSAPVARLRQAGRQIRAEKYVENGVYVIRADLPGVDPARDIDVSVHGGTVEIKAIRRDDLKARWHSEIPYGLYRRVLTLPDDADGDTLTTRYRDGVLEVAIALPGAGREPAPDRETTPLRLRR
ncbi:Hsp20/alpha crystallin family protein [Actinomadura sp. 9N407]|uniref:Hsp20/alpha crystallin family protein n=1 Tax=Actinomadura sp. 9N407 TaxID=3375154 RepID=UPI0037B05515